MKTMNHALYVYEKCDSSRGSSNPTEKLDNPRS